MDFKSLNQYTTRKLQKSVKNEEGLNSGAGRAGGGQAAREMKLPYLELRGERGEDLGGSMVSGLGSSRFMGGGDDLW